MQKNVASQKLIVFAFDSTTNSPKTGDAANLTAYVSKDFGAVTVLGDTTATEMDSTNAKGYYLFDLTQSETNADALLFSAKSSTANIVVLGCPAYVQTVPSAFALAGGASGGFLISGSNSGTTTLGALTVTGSMTVSDGLLVSRSTSNASAITATGNGTGSGIVATSGSGATGDGIQATAASTNGNGFVSVGTGTGSGLKATGGATGHGVLATGGATSGDGVRATAATSGIGLNAIGIGTTQPGIKGTGGTTTSAGLSLVGGGTSGDGLLIATTSGHGINVAGAGTTKHGIFAQGGATTSAGIAAAGGGTSGDGILITATSGHGISTTGAGTTKHGIHAAGGSTTSHGINAIGGGVGHGILATSGSGATGDGIRATAASTNGNGLNVLGVGTGAGLLTTGGATGIGLSAVGGATSGDAIKAVTTSGHGLNLAPVGTGMHGLLATGGNGATSDGIKAVAGTGGVPIRGDITGNITGNLSGTVTTVTTLTNLPAITANWLTATGIASDAFTAAKFAADCITAAKIADGAIDRATFAADTGLQNIRANTAQAGAGSSITLDASASATTDYYKNDLVYITGGVGVGQSRFITAYNGTTKVATVNNAWATNPDATSTFAIIPFDSIPGATAPTAAAVATAVWQDATAGDFTVAGSIGKSLFTSGAVPGAAGGLFIAGTNAATTITTALTTTFTGNLTGSVASVTGAVGSVTGAVGSVSTGGITAASIADGAIDRATFAADTGLQSIRSGTAQAGAAGTITLDASASSTTNFYRGCLIYLTGGTGVGQVEACFSYDGTTKVATMWKNWKTTPDNTTTFAVLPSYTAGVSTSLYAASDLLSISGTAGSNVSGLSSLGTAYGAGTLTTNITGTLSTVTTLTNLPAITSNWLTAAGLAADAVAEIADGVWDEVQSGHTTAGTFGKNLDAQVSTVGGGTAASIADAVWDEVLSGHLTAGSTGYALNAAGSAGDPWSTSLPGSYTGTTAGFIIGTMRAATFAVQFPIISDDNSFEMVIGDDYYAADGRNLSFSIGATPSLSGATVRFKIQLTEDDAGYTTSNTYTSTTGTVSGSSTQVMSFDVPGTTTDDMSEGWHDYEVEATLSSGHVTTLVRGRVNALSQVV